MLLCLQKIFREKNLVSSKGSSKKQESSRKTSISALLTMQKPLTVWITINCGKFWKRWEYQTTWYIFFLILFFNFTILYWFCHISTWIHHRYTYSCSPSRTLLPPHTIPLGRLSAPAPSIQYHASKLDWRFVSYMILYMFQCHSPRSDNRLCRGWINSILQISVHVLELTTQLWSVCWKSTLAVKNRVIYFRKVKVNLVLMCVCVCVCAYVGIFPCELE